MDAVEGGVLSISGTSEETEFSNFGVRARGAVSQGFCGAKRTGAVLGEEGM